jgi:hypothetical protein
MSHDDCQLIEDYLHERLAAELQEAGFNINIKDLLN